MRPLLLAALLAMPAPAYAGDAVTWLSAVSVGTTALDVHSTMVALRAGGREANPAMRWVERHPGRYVALRASLAALTVVAARKARKRDRLLAIGALVGVSALNVWAAQHNYRLASGRAGGER